MAEAPAGRAVLELRLGRPPTHAGFRWEECPEGLCLHFPPPDFPPRVAVTRWLCRGTLGAAAAAVALAATGHPLGTRYTVLAVVLAAVGGMFGVMSLLDDARRRRGVRRSIARLTIGPDGVAAEDRGGRARGWPRAAVAGVRVESGVCGDIEPGNAQVYYTVHLALADGSSVPLWGRATRDDLPFFRETEYSESNIRAAAAWLSSTVSRAVGLPNGAGGGTAVGAPDAESSAAADPGRM